MPLALAAATDTHHQAFRVYGAASSEAVSNFEVVGGFVSCDVAGARFYRHTAPAEADTLRLAREPANRHDANAVAVTNATRSQQLGHLPRTVAAALAPVLDAGSVRVSCRCRGYSAADGGGGGGGGDAVSLDLTVYTLHGLVPWVHSKLAACPAFTPAQELQRRSCGSAGATDTGCA